MRIDREWEKPFDNISAMSYILNHPHAFNEFLSKFKKSDAIKIGMQFLKDEPAILAALLKRNFEYSETIRVQAATNEISQEGAFTLMLGLPGAGKTASGAWISELLMKRDIKVYWFGYSPALAVAYPDIKQTFNLREINNGVLIYDELLLTLFGRNAMTKEVKDRVLNFPVARHHGYAVICLSQSPRIDPLMKDLISYIWFKPFVISGMFEKRMRFKPFIKYLIPHRKNENLLYNMSNNECVMFTNPLASRWSNELSKSMAPITDMGQAKHYAKMLEEAELNNREVVRFLDQRNIPMSWVTQELNIMTCPKCHSMELQRYGREAGRQKWKCSSCSHIFRE